MKKIFIYGLTYLLVTAGTATGVKLFGSRKGGTNPSTGDDPSSTIPVPPPPPTPAERFLSELLEAGNLEIDAAITLKKQESALADIGFVGDLCMEDFSDIQVAGDLTIVSPFVDLDVSLAYLDSYVYAYNDVINAKLETNHAMTGISQLMTLFGVNLPTDALSGAFGDLSLDGLLESFTNITFTLQDGYFKATLPIEGLTDIDLFVDADYRLHKVVIDEFKMDEYSLSLSVDTNILGKGNKQVTCPETATHPFDDYSTIFHFIENAYRLSQQRQFAMHVVADLQKGEAPLTKLDARTSFDLGEEKAFDLALQMDAKETHYEVTTQYQKNELYFTLNDLLKGHLTGSDITRMQQIIEEYAGSDVPSFLQKAMDDFMASEWMQKIQQYDFHDLLDIFKKVSFDGENLVIEADLSCFLEGSGLIRMTLQGEENAIRSLSLENFSYQGYQGNLVITLETYEGLREIDVTAYEDYAPVFTIFDEAKRLSQEDHFAFQLNADIQNQEKSYHIEGLVQFAFETIVDEETMLSTPDNHAYIDLLIQDGTKNHQLIMEVEQNVMYFAYNNKLFGQMAISTLKDMIKQVQELIASDDPLMSEIAGLIPSGDELSILGQILSGNYQNVSLDLCKKFSVQPNGLNVVLSSTLFQSVNDLDLTIGYNETSLTSLTIHDFQISTLSLSCALQFDTYHSELSLDKNQNYLDLNSLNLLLEFGITTMHQEYYTLQGKATINLASIYKLELDVIVKLHNVQGKVEAYISLPNIPLFHVAGYGNYLPTDLKDNQGNGYMTANSWGYKPSENRSAEIYIYDGYTYIYRQETAEFHKHNSLGTPLPAKVKETYIRAIKTTTKHFLQNISYYLFSTALGFNDNFMNIVNENMTMLPVEEMKFDELITGMTYSSGESRFSYDLNLAALTGNTATKSTNLSLYHADTNGENHLSKLTLSMSVSVVITIQIDIALEIVDYGSSFDPQFIYDFCQQYSYEEELEYHSHVA